MSADGLTRRSVAGCPLRIGFLTPEYPTETYSGGIGSYIYQMAHSLANLGHTIFVLLCDGSGECATFDGAIAIRRIVLQGLASRLPAPLGKRSGVLFARRLATVVRELALDILEAPEFGGLTAWFNGAKPPQLHVVVRLHTCSCICRWLNGNHETSTRTRLRNKLQDWLETRAINTADSVTAISATTVERTHRLLGIRRNDIHVTANPVNTTFFSAPEDRPAFDDSALILFVGRLEWRKGPDLLVRAFQSVLAQHPNARLCLAGGDTNTAPNGGSMLSYLSALIPEHVRPHVQFAGVMTAEQIFKKCCEASVCVFPSRWEGFGLVAAEAMACGKAVVVSDTPGFRELLGDPPGGVFARTDDPNAFSTAINALLSDHRLRRDVGVAARQRALQFNGDAVAKATLQFYRQALGTAP